MKRFRFRLKSILELRASQEQAAQREYGETVREKEAAAARVEAANLELREAWQSMRSWSGLPVDELRRGRAWCSALDEKQKQAASELVTAEEKMDAARSKLVNATRKRETMDRLFRKHRESHERMAFLEEQKFLDELATRCRWQPHSEAA